MSLYGRRIAMASGGRLGGLASGEFRGHYTKLPSIGLHDALARHVPNWRAMRQHGLEAGDVGEHGEALAEAIEARLRTGRPLAAAEWVEDQEAALGRKLAQAKRGPKPKARV